MHHRPQLPVRAAVSGALLFLFASLGAGCSRSTEPYDVTRLFAVGASPNAELDILRRHLEGHGFRITQLRHGDGLAALVAEDDNGRTALRITTPRGVALAMDAPHSPEHRFDRLALAAQEQPDIDADGHPDVIIEGYDSALDRHCLAVLHADETGALRERTLGLPSLDAQWCLRSLSSSGPLEGHFELRWPWLPFSPLLRVPLRGRPWDRRGDLQMEQPSPCLVQAFAAAVGLALDRATPQEALDAFDEHARSCPPEESQSTLRAAIQNWSASP